MDDQEQERKATQGQESRRAGERRFRIGVEAVFLFNFLWVLLLGVGILWWIGSFTGHLETVVGLLGLGGIFAWSAFFLGLIREERKKALQGLLDEILGLKTTSCVLIALTAIMVLAAWNLGCIMVDSTRDTRDRWMAIRRIDGGISSRTTGLPPRLKSKFLVCTGFHGRDYEIDVEGLPLMVRHVRPFSRAQLKAPGDFLRRCVVLVRPSPTVCTYSSQPDVNQVLQISVDGNAVDEMPFHGRAVWIGAGKPLHLPSLLTEKWRVELAADPSASPATLLAWLEPNVFVSRKLQQLETGKRLEVRVAAPGAQHVFARGEIALRACTGEDDFPQILYLKEEQ